MRNQGIGSWPARRARMGPDRPAMVYEGETISYAETSERVYRLAHALLGLGVRRGDRVAYLGPNHPAFLETLFATGALGAIFVPLNTRLSPPELEYILADSGATTLVYAPETADTVASFGDGARRIDRVIALRDPREGELDYAETLAGAPADPLDHPVDPDDVCMLMYTSGTTGRPKGAMITHGNVTWNCVNVMIDLDLSRDEVTLVSAPMFHTASLNMTCLPTFLKGGAAVIMPAFRPELAFDLIERNRVTWMFGVPAMFNAMAQSPRWESADLSSVRILECGGAPVPEHLIQTYRDRGLVFLQGYGMTEASPGALFLGPEAADRVGSAGKPSFFTDVRLLRPDASEAGPGETGEIAVQGPNVMKGYWGRPEATRDGFVEGWFRSGDAATVDADGYFHIVDRIKDMFISGGENVFPAEIEAALIEHPAVGECAVIGVADETWGEVGKAFVVVLPGHHATADELLDFLSGRIAKYKIPKFVEFIDAVPRNAAGKAQKQRLR